jgi:acetyl-CoA synthetase
VTGTSYGIISPLVNRVTMLSTRRSSTSTAGTDGPGEKVEVWYSAPTAIRMMMRGEAAAAPYDFSSLGSWPAWASR